MNSIETNWIRVGVREFEAFAMNVYQVVKFTFNRLSEVRPCPHLFRFAFRSRSGPVPLVRVAFTPAKIDRNRSGCGPVTRSHLFRTRSGTRSLRLAYHVVRSDVKIIKTKAGKRACRNLRRNESRQRAKK